MLALISNEEMEQLGQIMVKQLKNRYNDPTMYKRFVVGIDRAKMSCMIVIKEHKMTSSMQVISNLPPNPKKTFDGFKI